MNLQTLIGRALLALVAPLAAYLAAHYKQPELGGVLSAGIAAIGGELLLRQSPPGKGSVPTGLMPLLLIGFLGTVLGTGCALLQKPSVRTVVYCTGDVLATCKADLVQLLACLDVSDPTLCALAVGNAAGCAGKEALACKVREAAEPSVKLTLVSPTADEERRQVAAKRIYSELGVEPLAPITP